VKCIVNATKEQMRLAHKPISVSLDHQRHRCKGGLACSRSGCAVRRYGWRIRSE
jgi:hypothetical protein